MAKLASDPITQDLPTTEDGKIYISLGHAISTYQITLTVNKPIYYYKDGRIQLWTGKKETKQYQETFDITSTGTNLVSSITVNHNLNTDGLIVGVTVDTGTQKYIADQGTLTDGSRACYSITISDNNTIVIKFVMIPNGSTAKVTILGY